ncbi:MAG: hypothetical protein JNJ58_08805 [Chitinophagaceae bacterium]|nr:hypothetical protein [Chitinophagaceae bacterium]
MKYYFILLLLTVGMSSYGQSILLDSNLVLTIDGKDTVYSDNSPNLVSDTKVQKGSKPEIYVFLDVFPPEHFFYGNLYNYIENKLGHKLIHSAFIQQHDIRVNCRILKNGDIELINIVNSKDEVLNGKIKQMISSMPPWKKLVVMGTSLAYIETLYIRP